MTPSAVETGVKGHGSKTRIADLPNMPLMGVLCAAVGEDRGKGCCEGTARRIMRSQIIGGEEQIEFDESTQRCEEAIETRCRCSGSETKVAISFMMTCPFCVQGSGEELDPPSA